ncbi:hypothetical protein DERP_013224 [Dermatophagoides pteronyssinus]|uniref:Uncharacterized protein n=1 Tax=Dermatophagoides pteronyssinus TaxID=6956 RepID=A0ABQ8IRI1_DERPT|nr:hypothetical protein DERP_013224 [Dermatophagoides pteronyssinus]
MQILSSNQKGSPLLPLPHKSTSLMQIINLPIGVALVLPFWLVDQFKIPIILLISHSIQINS